MPGDLYLGRNRDNLTVGEGQVSMIKKARSRKQEEGFALIIVGALFLAFAMIMGAVIDRTNATKQQALIDRTQQQLSRLSDALIRYSIDNYSRYPCPASPTIALNATGFGQSIPGCEAGHATGVEALSTGVQRGMIPVNDLLIYGAVPNDAFDAWGNRIMYIIDRQLTPDSSGENSSSRPVVTDATTGTTITYRSPDFVLLSYGRDGVGAIPKNATTVAIPCGTGSDMRFDNCKSTVNFTVRPVTSGPGIISTQYFDDLLTFYGK